MDFRGAADIWCGLCEERVAVSTSADGVPACQRCIEDTLNRIKFESSRSERRRRFRAERKHGRGYTR